MPFQYQARVSSVDPGRKTGLTLAMRAEILQASLEEFYKTLMRKVKTRGNHQWSAAKWRMDKPVMSGIEKPKYWQKGYFGAQEIASLVAVPTSRQRNGAAYDIQQVHSAGPYTITPKHAQALYVPYSDRAYRVTATYAYGMYKAGRWIMGRIQKDGWHGYRYDPIDESGSDTGERPDFFFLPRVRLSRRSLELTDREIKDIEKAVAIKVRHITRRWALEIGTRYD